MRLNATELTALLDSDSPRDAAPAAAHFSRVSTDTRTIQPGDLFVALVSDKADGHDYIDVAIQAGAAGVVVMKPVSETVAVPVFRVADTVVAYGHLARHYRDQFDVPVVAVTGSVGKTTAKEMLAAVLSPLGPILKTPASQNNETGVPKTLLQLDETHASAIIEMGMRGSGQIAALCEVARPDIGVVTLVADNHIELLGTRDAIADAKGELVTALSPGGIAVLNADDPYLARLRAKTTGRVITFGIDYPADFRATDIAAASGGWSFQVKGVPLCVPSASRHDVLNATAALAVASTLGVSLEAAAEALADYVQPPMRMELMSAAGWGGTILNDAYNAAPASVASALRTLRDFGTGRKIAFLGDMRELGDIAVRAHEELGDVISGLGGVDALYTVGGLAKHIPGAVKHFANCEEAVRFAESLPLQPGDVVLVKGSRAMAMEKVGKALAGRG